MNNVSSGKLQLSSEPGPNYEFWREVARSIFEAHKWIERKVETLEFDTSHGSTRITSSFDLIAPLCFSQLEWIPVTIFEKKNLIDLDIRDSSGHALATLVRKDNVSFGMELLFSGCKRNRNLDETLNLLNKIVDFSAERLHPRLSEDDLKKEKEELIQQLNDILLISTKNMYMFLAELLIDAFIFWVQLPTDHVFGRREIVKISRELEIPYRDQTPKAKDNRAYGLSVNVVTTMCSSYHIEVHAPNGLLIKNLRILELRPTVKSGKREVRRFVAGRSNGQASQIVHAKSRRTNRRYSSLARFHITSQRDNFARMSLCASLLVFLLYFLGVIDFFVKHFLHQNLIAPNEGSIGTTILLVGPAILLFFLANQPEHQMVSYILRPGRRHLFASASGLVLSAFLLSGSINETLTGLRYTSWSLWTFGLILSTWSFRSVWVWFNLWTTKTWVKA